MAGRKSINVFFALLPVLLLLLGPNVSSGGAFARAELSFLAHDMPEVCKERMDAALTADDFFPAPSPISWSPRKGRYLVPMCQFGRLTNQLICIHRYLWFAGLLNRTVVLPDTGSKDGLAPPNDGGYSWAWADVIDVPGMAACLAPCCGPRPLLLLSQLLEETGRVCLAVDHVAALIPRNIPEFGGRKRVPGLCDPFGGTAEVLSPSGSWTIPWGAFARLQRNDVAVLTLGSLFSSARVEGVRMEFGGRLPFRLAPRLGCGDIPSPGRELVAVADKIAAALFGRRRGYLALHFRRGDFLLHYKVGQSSSYMTLLQVARFLASWLPAVNGTGLYVSSDASPTAIGLLAALVQDLMGQPGFKIVHLHTLRTMADGVEGRAPSDRVSSLLRHLDALPPLTQAVVEKCVCAQSRAFLGTRASTFSSDIQRMRRLHGWASCWDTNLHILS